MRGYVWDCLLAGIHFCFSGFFCAYGRSGLSFLHNALSILLARIPLAYLASLHFPHTLYPMGLATSSGSALPALGRLALFPPLPSPPPPEPPPPPRAPPAGSIEDLPAPPGGRGLPHPSPHTDPPHETPLPSPGRPPCPPPRRPSLPHPMPQETRPMPSPGKGMSRRGMP